MYSTDYRGMLLPLGAVVLLGGITFWPELTGTFSTVLLCPIKIYVLDNFHIVYSLTWLCPFSSPAILLVLCYLTFLSSSLDIYKISASHLPLQAFVPPLHSARKAHAPYSLIWKTPILFGPQLKGPFWEKHSFCTFVCWHF